MGCLFLMMAGIFPRLGTILVWLARPTYFSAAFGNSILWPILGIIFLPFTTLMYVFIWNPTTGISGSDWLWLILAAVIDISHWAANGYANRDRIPGYSA